MRTIPLDRYRNIGILASLDAGRTTTTERILAAARRVAGDAPAAGSLPVWLEQDNQRDITLTSAATSCAWRDCRINIIELPTAPHEPDDSAIAALDAAVVLVDATRGVGADIAGLLARLDALGVARLVFVNKLDRDDADLDAVLVSLAELGPARPILLNLPLRSAGILSGIVDLVAGGALTWGDAKLDTASTAGSVPQAMAEAVAAGHAAIRVAVDAPTGAEDLALLVRQAVRRNLILPVLVGSAFRNRGIDALLDGIVDYLPAPSELALRAVATDGRRIERRPADDEPFAGLAFQTVDDAAAGKLTFVRIYSGVVATGNVMLNSVSTTSEQIGPMMRMHANHTESIVEAHAGDIVALFGLEHTMTGDTLCDPAAPVILERIPAAAGRAKH